MSSVYLILQKFEGSIDDFWYPIKIRKTYEEAAKFVNEKTVEVINARYEVEYYDEDFIQNTIIEGTVPLVQPDKVVSTEWMQIVEYSLD